MPRFYTPMEISEILKISYNVALDYIRNSGIPYQRIGRQYRVSVDAFNEFVKETHIMEIE